MSIAACHNCKTGPGAHCADCKRVSQDDIRIQHTPHNRSELQAATIQPRSERATPLPVDVEQKLRAFLFDLFDLSPIRLLLLQHVRQHGTPVSFRGYFLKFLKDSIKYGVRERKPEWDALCEQIGAHIGRATAKAMWDNMLEQNPLFAVFQSWDKGHGGRQAEEHDEPRQVQGELDFDGAAND